MVSINKKRFRISNADLKKAIVEKNASLKKQNDKLGKSIKDQEGQLKSLEKEYNSEANKLRKLLIDVEFQEDRFTKLKGGVYSTDKLLKSNLDAASNAEKDAKKYEDKALKQEEKERKLIEKIEQLKFYKNKLESSKVEFASLQAKKDSALDDIASVESEISKIKSDGESMVANYNKSYNEYEAEIEKRQEFAKTLEGQLSSAKDAIIQERDRLDKVRIIIEGEKNIADNELQAVKNLTNDTEDKYIEWEAKVEKLKAKADKEESRIIRSKEKFEQYKIGMLEEVARKKLKNKIENIDKAGLSDILNNG
jgi:chromosome segregation ATPase